MNKFTVIDNEQISVEEIAEALLNSPIFAVGIKNSIFIEEMAKHLKFHQRAGLYSEKYGHVPIHIAKMNLKEYEYEEQSECSEVWWKVFHEIFNRWTVAGFNKRKAKSPFGCKSFYDFCPVEEFSKLPYVVFAVPTEVELDPLWHADK